jgi:hypothetical protein
MASVAWSFATNAGLKREVGAASFQWKILLFESLL